MSGQARYDGKLERPDSISRLFCLYPNLEKNRSYPEMVWQGTDLVFDNYEVLNFFATSKSFCCQMQKSTAADYGHGGSKYQKRKPGQIIRYAYRVGNVQKTETTDLLI